MSQLIWSCPRISRKIRITKLGCWVHQILEIQILEIKQRMGVCVNKLLLVQKWNKLSSWMVVIVNEWAELSMSIDDTIINSKIIGPEMEQDK